MQKVIFAISVLAFLCGCKDDHDNNEQINTTDRDFTMKAAMGNTAEIDAGQVASTKGMAADIKSFGTNMVNDHGTALGQLHSIANDLSLYAPDSLDAPNVELAAKLSALSGREFDSVYIHTQVDAHLQTIALFQNEIDNGSQYRLKAYANDLMPHLRMHLADAQGIAANY